MDPDYDYMTFPEVVASAVDAYAQAGIKDPRQALAMAEVHDCFTPTELVLMEDLGFAARGTAWKEVLAGTFRPRRRAGGEPRRRAQVLRPSDRRLRAPDALRGVAPAPWRGGKRQIASVARGRRLALTHNPGGAPGECVSLVGIVGSEPSVASRVRPAVLSPASHWTRKATT